MKKTIVIVGLGLIGGSFAKAITHYTDHRVIGIDSNPAVMDSALEQGAIKHEGKPEDLAKADLVIMCLYPQLTISFMQQYAHLINPNAIVTDACGIKTSVCAELEALSDKHGFVYIGGHPMAGREKGGFDYSLTDLYKGASFIFTPCEDKLEDERFVSSFDWLKQLMLQIGFGRITITTPQEHDRIIAYTSQVPHVLACAYMFSPSCEQHSGYSAGSYKDVSRVALINEDLWSDAFLGNRPALIKEIDELISNLNLIRNAVEDNNYDELHDLLKKGRELKQRLG